MGAIDGVTGMFSDVSPLFRVPSKTKRRGRDVELNLSATHTKANRVPPV